jgi:hypothetical protein
MVSQKNADAEKSTYCRDDLGHNFAPWFEVPALGGSSDGLHSWAKNGQAPPRRLIGSKPLACFGVASRSQKSGFVGTDFLFCCRAITKQLRDGALERDF